MATTYSTRDEAIQREIIEPIMAGEVDSIDEYDVDAIATAVLGDYSEGFACQVTVEEFWAVVEGNARLAESRETTAMTVVSSTTQTADLTPAEADDIIDRVDRGEILRSSETVDEIGQASSVARVVSYPHEGKTCYALRWWDENNAEIVSYGTQTEADVAYERHVRDLLSAGWVWDETDVDDLAG